MVDSEHVGARLRGWRQRRGMTQRVLANLAGFSQSYIAQIEAGTAVPDRRATREALAGALQISVGELIGDYGEAAPYDPVGAAGAAELRSGVFAFACPELAVGPVRD